MNAALRSRQYSVEIWGPHYNKYLDYPLMGCGVMYLIPDTVQFSLQAPMFCRSLLPAAAAATAAELQHIPVNHNLYFVFFVGVRVFDTVHLFTHMNKMCESRFGDL